MGYPRYIDRGRKRKNAFVEQRDVAEPSWTFILRRQPQEPVPIFKAKSPVRVEDDILTYKGESKFAEWFSDTFRMLEITVVVNLNLNLKMNQERVYDAASSNNTVE